ncbi:hypothetical protein IAD21_01211 [Abditibacteriota bacterium]|nr:hypothetical protein IAD21_01211 [Abditibacteriota bacterium]
MRWLALFEPHWSNMSIPNPQSNFSARSLLAAGVTLVTLTSASISIAQKPLNTTSFDDEPFVVFDSNLPRISEKDMSWAIDAADDMFGSVMAKKGKDDMDYSTGVKDLLSLPGYQTSDTTFRDRPATRFHFSGSRNDGVALYNNTVEQIEKYCSKRPKDWTRKTLVKGNQRAFRAYFGESGVCLTVLYQGADSAPDKTVVTLVVQASGNKNEGLSSIPTEITSEGTGSPSTWGAGSPPQAASSVVAGHLANLGTGTNADDGKITIYTNRTEFLKVVRQDGQRFKRDVDIVDLTFDEPSWGTEPSLVNRGQEGLVANSDLRFVGWRHDGNRWWAYETFHFTPAYDSGNYVVNGTGALGGGRCLLNIYLKPGISAIGMDLGRSKVPAVGNRVEVRAVSYPMNFFATGPTRPSAAHYMDLPATPSFIGFVVKGTSWSMGDIAINSTTPGETVPYPIIDNVVYARQVEMGTNSTQPPLGPAIPTPTPVTPTPPPTPMYADRYLREHRTIKPHDPVPDGWIRTWYGGTENQVSEIVITRYDNLHIGEELSVIKEDQPPDGWIQVDYDATMRAPRRIRRVR